MSLKDIIDKAAPLGMALRAIRDRMVSQGNAEESEASLLNSFLAAHGLSGCCPTDEICKKFCDEIIATTELPTAEEIEAASAGMLSDADKEAVAKVLQLEALRVGVLKYICTVVPSNAL